MENSYKRKNYYQSRGRGGGRGGYGSNNSWSNKKFKNYLKPGSSGFLCTCNMREKDCIRESLNVLNEYADKLGILKPNQVSDELPQGTVEMDNTSEAQGEDIEDELQKEVSSLKTVDCQRRGLFSVLDTGVKNNIFISSTIEDPVKVAYAILDDVATTKVPKGRFLLRIVPVEVTCRANLEDIKTAADALFDKHFKCEPTTFAILINKRYNDTILRDELIHALALLVTDRNQEHKANLKEAKKTVLLEIMKGLCCISVLEDYKRLRHYNVSELAKPEGVGEGGSGGNREEADGEAKEDAGQKAEEEEKMVESGKEIEDKPENEKISEEAETDH